jgi:hypothetical protein
VRFIGCDCGANIVFEIRHIHRLLSFECIYSLTLIDYNKFNVKDIWMIYIFNDLTSRDNVKT